MTTCPNCGKEIEMSSAAEKETDGEKGRKTRLPYWILGISLVSLIVAITILLVAIFGRQQTIHAYNPNILNLRFECFDSDSGENITDCSIHLRIIEESQVQEFDVFSTEDAINIPVQTRLSIIVTSPGYSTYSEIFEYIDLGNTQIHEINLHRSVP
jgi:hypothetical protein